MSAASAFGHLLTAETLHSQLILCTVHRIGTLCTLSTHCTNTAHLAKMVHTVHKQHCTLYTLHPSPWAVLQAGGMRRGKRP